MSEDNSTVYRGEPLLPVIRYAGGKRWLSDVMRAFAEVNPTERFVEPFAGGMAISLAVRNPVTIVNDINPHVINLYRQIKDGLSITLTMENTQSRYDFNRELFNQKILNGELETKEAAQLYYYLIKTDFNGLSRFNKRGLFNVPFGKIKSVNYHNNFDDYKKQFERWEFHRMDFSQLEMGTNDFTFIDCPYDDSFSSYSQEGFTWEDQVRVAEWASDLSGPVVCTNLSTQRIVDMYKELEFEVRFMKARRSISCKGGERKPVMEMIAVKNAYIPSIFLDKSLDVCDPI